MNTYGGKYFHNWIKVLGNQTIINEQRLSKEGLEGKLPRVPDVILYHGFKQLTMLLKPYVKN